jgi:hypothetical protein
MSDSTTMRCMPSRSLLSSYLSGALWSSTSYTRRGWGIQGVWLLPIALPIHVSVFYDEIRCLLCQDDGDRYVCRGRTAIEDHLKKVHKQPLRQSGRWRRGEVGGIKSLAQAGLVRTPVSWQTLFHGSRCTGTILRFTYVKLAMASWPTRILHVCRIAWSSPNHVETNMENMSGLE